MTVELFGLARALAGRGSIEVPVDEPVGMSAFVRALADACPALVGDVVSPGRDGFIPPNLLLLDGRRAVGPQARFTGADRPCVLFVPSGG
jgi:hypothetical protein